MLLYIVITYLFLLLLIWQRVKDKTSRLLSFAYVSYWCASLFLCEVNPFGYYKVSEYAYGVLMGHLIAFMGGFVIHKPKTEINFGRVQYYSVKRIINNKSFLSIYFVCIIFILVLYYRQRMLLALYTLSDLRGDFMSMILEGSGLSYLFYEIIGTGMFHFTLCLLSYMLFFERKWLYIAFIFLYDLVWALVSGGRAQVMTIGFYLFSMFLISDYVKSVKSGHYSRYNLSLRAKVTSLIFVVGLVGSMSIVSFMKQSTGKIDNEALFEGLSRLGMDLSEYSSGPIVAFDQGLKDSEIRPKKYQYGAATFCGADYFLYIALRRYGLHETSSYDQTTHVFQEAKMNVSRERAWNYAYTSCMYYYHDFGLMGIILISFLFGFITRRVISRLFVSADIYNIAFFTFVCFCLYMSVFSGYTHKMVVVFYVSALLVLSYNTNSHHRGLINR